jgi:DNA-binding FrmR family transcriptional regulator
MRNILCDTIPGYSIGILMPHTARDKKKLLHRIRRIRGQLNGLEKAVEEERGCGDVLLTLAACRGAMNSLMAEILEGHVREHVLQQTSQPDPGSVQAAEELVEVIKRYLR